MATEQLSSKTFTGWDAADFHNSTPILSTVLSNLKKLTRGYTRREWQRLKLGGPARAHLEDNSILHACKQHFGALETKATAT
eukprot:5932993-Amphidinium_carterae.1